MNKIYDCNLCMHKEVCDLWAKKIAYSDPKSRPDDGDDFVSCPSVSYGCRHFDSKRRYICISEEMEYMRRGLYMQEEQLKVLRVKLYKHLKEANQCGDASGRGNG